MRTYDYQVNFVRHNAILPDKENGSVQSHNEEKARELIEQRLREKEGKLDYFRLTYLSERDKD